MATGAKSPQTVDIYGVHPAVAMTRDWIASLKSKTGRNLDEWLALISQSGQVDEKSRAAWLKSKHRLGTNQAGWLAARSLGQCQEDEDPEAYRRQALQWVEQMFDGPKAGLRPLYEALLLTAAQLGKDIRACPCRTIVPLYRRHVFAQIKPSTRKRIDLGLALGDQKAAGRLLDTGGFAKKDRITHRIPIESQADIDRQVERWLRKAYDRDA